MKPSILASGMLWMQVCVPIGWSEDKICQWAHEQVKGPWEPLSQRVLTEPDGRQHPQRVRCAHDSSFQHIMIGLVQ